MYNFYSEYNIISDSWFGFQFGFSTKSAFISVFHSWQQSLDSSLLSVQSYNLCKAFDSIPHFPLLDSLSSLHHPPALLNWFHFYLVNHSQQVVANGTISSNITVTSGVPQGSNLGPLLLIFYISDITKLSLLPYQY